MTQPTPRKTINGSMIVVRSSCQIIASDDRVHAFVFMIMLIVMFVLHRVGKHTSPSMVTELVVRRCALSVIWSVVPCRVFIDRCPCRQKAAKHPQKQTFGPWPHSCVPMVIVVVIWWNDWIEAPLPRRPYLQNRYYIDQVRIDIGQLNGTKSSTLLQNLTKLTRWG